MTVATTLPALYGPIDACDARLRAVVDAHYEGLWRFLRRMGVGESEVEDAAQQVLLVFARRAPDVEPGAERSFLFGAALRVASDFRRKAKQPAEGIEALAGRADPGPDAEHELGQKELRACLDRAMGEMNEDLRTVFVLAELEELTMAEISTLLGIPAGTVASRLRRAREVFEAKAADLRAFVEKGGAP
jgi:RNA polymerase sigma-70 factor, ECF subfamily